MFDKNYFEDRLYMIGDDVKGYNYDLAIWLKDNFQFNTFLDVGCGHGLLIEHLHNLEKKVVGLDESGYILDIVKQRNPEIEVEMASLPQLSELEEFRYFDIVYCAGVLEYMHYSTIIASIRNMWKHVSTPGFLIIDTIPENQKNMDSLFKSVHNFDWWKKKLTKKPFHFELDETPFNGELSKYEGRNGMFIIKK